MSGGATGHRNRLAEATSPYLLQHAENPVDWHEWGEEALERARKEDKPILLSIGYSACHWCHVMAHESFEDPEIGAQMSRDFVCIKVDREERPDLDDVYMAATLAMNHGQGGWPMTVFLTPEQEPFFAGTYFPPEDRWGRPGFRSLLTRIAEAWRDDRDRIREQGARLAEHLRENARAAPGLQLGESEIQSAVAQLDRAFDERHGGFGPAPKFPPSVALSLLLRAWRRFGDERALDMARRTLDAMARGGMYDQLGGGFHRYSVDAEWLVPHFEKMLYDNAQLARIYTEAWAATGEPFYRRIATEILDYVLREMTDSEGGFYSATDADSEGEEGRFFVWTPDEVREGLGDAVAAERFCAFYDVTEAGNWEGRSILRTLREPAEVARELGIEEEELVRGLEESRRKLYEVRSRRVAPGLDDKVLTAWNGLMLGAFAEAARVFGEPRYLEAARRNAAFLLGALRREDGGLRRTWRRGRAQLDAYLEDYAYLAGALVDLYEASGERADLDTAAELAERLRRDFAAPEGGFYSVAEGHERLIVRPREGHDGAIPNANASAAHALARLGFHLGREELRDEATRALRAWGRVIAQHPRGFCRALEVADLLLEGPVELAVVGTPGEPDFEALWAELGRQYTPNRVIARSPSGGAAPSHPLLEGREGVDDRAALYVCRDFVCRRPVTSPEGVADALSAHRDEAPEAPRTLTLPRTPGAATSEGTAAWAERHRERLPHGYGPLGKTGLTCSRIGFGGYRVDDDDAEHREALVRAVLAGINLIDTASTYTLGSSERLVGEVVADLTRSGSAAREELIVVSKLGFLQGPSLERARERADAGSPWPEVVRLSETAWHCIHPAFLDDELDQSLERLRLDRIDLLLLHNPESFLEANGGEGDRASGRAELERRLEQAFAWAESAVASGRIGGYGVSSNTLGFGAEDPRALPREAVLGAARRAGGEAHGFVALQVPLNLLEGEAALRSEDGESLLAWAQGQGLGVLANRPLNAARDGRVVRLADFEVGAPADLDAALEALGALEEEFRKGLATRLRTGPGLPGPDQLFRWSQELDEIRRQRPGLPQWAQIEAAHLHPRLLRTLASLDRALEGDSAREWHAWRERYLPHLERALHELDRRARERSREEAAPAARALEARLPSERRGESLSRQALWTAASVRRVSCALVGMRRTGYVADAVEVLRWPPLAEAEEVLRDLAR